MMCATFRQSLYVLVFTICFVERYCGKISNDEKIVGFQKDGEISEKRTRLVDSYPTLEQRGRARRSYGNGRHRRPVDRLWCASNSSCAGNRTMFDRGPNFNCHCDHACFETFHDCCPDYEKICGKQETETTSSTQKRTRVFNFTCVKMGTKYNEDCLVGGAKGVWMIQTCPAMWLSRETRRKCQNPPSRFSHPVEDYLPVVGENQFTYRNKHCAICHGVLNYTSWLVRVKTFVIPPEEYDFDAKLQFIVDNGGTIKFVGPMQNQPRRYCAGETYKDNCDRPNVFSKEYKDCINGPVEVVVDRYYYKNKACAACNGNTRAREWTKSAVCGIVPEGFTLTFNIKNHGVKLTRNIVSKYCIDGTVYDKALEFCRKGFETSPNDSLSNVFLFVMWFQKSSIVYSSNFQRYFGLALSENFHLLPTQISAIKTHKQDIKGRYLVVTFRLTLTPYQDLVLADRHNTTSKEVSNTSKAFLKLLNFTGNFTFSFKNYSFPVIKLISKQLSCLDGKIFKAGDYHIHENIGQLFENKTGKYFALKDYSILDGPGGTITLCRKLVLSGCTKGAYVPLHPSEFVILPNLSLYHNATNRTFEFGDYQITESLNDVNSSTAASIFNARGQNYTANIARNKTFLICLPYQSSFNHSDTIETSFATPYPLRILTLVGFSVSIIFLLLLLTAHVMFKQLRTLPGLNLMSLSFSLLASHLIWLIGTTYLEGTTLCRAFAILEHYLLLVSFLAMSAISHHSSTVFSQPFVAPKPDDEGWRAFLKYSAVVWSCPAIFVTLCVILDSYGAFTIKYGTNCWLGTKEAKLYLFLLPVALLLLYNIFTFVKTALSFRRFQIQSQVLQKKRMQNFLVCVKLSTLLGFPWIFAFFSVLFPDVIVIEYMFVIFVCFQGFYIGVAFLFNKNTVALYKKRWKQTRQSNVRPTCQGQVNPVRGTHEGSQTKTTAKD